MSNGKDWNQIDSSRITTSENNTIVSDVDELGSFAFKKHASFVAGNVIA